MSMRAARSAYPSCLRSSLATLLTLLGLATAASAARDLGTAEVVSEAERCGKFFCTQIEVTCPDVAEPALATLRVRQPELGNSTDRGTVYLAVGGGGNGFWGEAYGKEAKRILRKLKRKGFITVEVKWDDLWYDGTPAGFEGQVRLGCRPATAARWIYDNIHTGDAFCASGNSGGSAQVSYMLTHYGLGSILSAIVPTGGPPMSQIDAGCFDAQPEGFPDMTYGGVAKSRIDQAFGFFDDDGPCKTGDDSFRQELSDASLNTLGEDYVFDKTMVWIILGEDDPGSAVGQAVLFHDKLLAEGTPLLELTVRKGVPHQVPSVRKGGNKILKVLNDNCVQWE